MDQPAFFKARDNLDRPSRRRFHPLGKNMGIVAVAQCAGSYHPGAVDGMTLDVAMESAQDLQAARHRFGIEIAVSEDAFPQARDFPVLIECNQSASPQLGDAQT